MLNQSPFRFPALANLLVLGLVAQAGPRAVAVLPVKGHADSVHPGMKVNLRISGKEAKHQKFIWRCLEADPGLLQGDPGHMMVFTAPRGEAPRTFHFQVAREATPQEPTTFEVAVTPWPRLTVTASAQSLFPGETCTLALLQGDQPPRNNSLRFMVDLWPESPAASPASLRIADDGVQAPAEGPIVFTAPEVDRPMRCRVTARSYAAMPAHVDLRIVPRLQAEGEHHRTGLQAGEALRVFAQRHDGQPASWSWELLEPRVGTLQAAPALEPEDAEWALVEASGEHSGTALYTAPADLREPLEVRLRATDRQAPTPQHVDLALQLRPRVSESSASAPGPAHRLPSVTLFAGSPRDWTHPEDPSRPPYHAASALAYLSCQVPGVGPGWLMGGSEGVWSVTGDGQEPVPIPALGRDVVAMAAGPASASQKTPLVVAHQARWTLPHVAIPYLGATQAYLTVLGADGRTRLLAGSRDFVLDGSHKPMAPLDQPVFPRITGLAVDAEGTVYVAEGSDRIRVVAPDGKVRTLVTSPFFNTFQTLAYDPVRHVLYASSPLGLFEVTREGGLRALWRRAPDSDGLDVRGMAIHGDQLLLAFADLGEPALKVFDLKAMILTPLVPATTVGQPLRQGPIPRFAPDLAPGACAAMPHPGCLAASPGGTCLAGLRDGLARVDLPAAPASPAKE